jgi:NADPH:quinone reductase-like Zn-dependent oxidoreductase
MRATLAMMGRMHGRRNLMRWSESGAVTPQGLTSCLRSSPEGKRRPYSVINPREMFEAMLRAIALHRIRPVIDRLFDFEHATDALQYLSKGSHVGKVVIRV